MPPRWKVKDQAFDLNFHNIHKHVWMIPKVMHTLHAFSTPLACAADLMLVNSLNFTFLIGILQTKVSCIYFLCRVIWSLWWICSGGLQYWIKGSKSIHQICNFMLLYTSRNLWFVARSVCWLKMMAQHNFMLVPEVSQGQDSVEDQ
jgi:hypothetical protein